MVPSLKQKSEYSTEILAYLKQNDYHFNFENYSTLLNKYLSVNILELSYKVISTKDEEKTWIIISCEDLIFDSKNPFDLLCAHIILACCHPDFNINRISFAFAYLLTLLEYADRNNDPKAWYRNILSDLGYFNDKNILSEDNLLVYQITEWLMKTTQVREYIKSASNLHAEQLRAINRAINDRPLSKENGRELKTPARKNPLCTISTYKIPTIKKFLFDTDTSIRALDIGYTPILFGQKDISEKNDYLVNPTISPFNNRK